MSLTVSRMYSPGALPASSAAAASSITYWRVPTIRSPPAGMSATAAVTRSRVLSATASGSAWQSHGSGSSEKRHLTEAGTRRRMARSSVFSVALRSVSARPARYPGSTSPPGASHLPNGSALQTPRRTAARAGSAGRHVAASGAPANAMRRQPIPRSEAVSSLGCRASSDGSARMSERQSTCGASRHVRSRSAPPPRRAACHPRRRQRSCQSGVPPLPPPPQQS